MEGQSNETKLIKSAISQDNLEAFSKLYDASANYVYEKGSALFHACLYNRSYECMRYILTHHPFYQEESNLAETALAMIYTGYNRVLRLIMFDIYSFSIARCYEFSCEVLSMWNIESLNYSQSKKLLKIIHYSTPARIGVSKDYLFFALTKDLAGRAQKWEDRKKTHCKLVATAYIGLVENNRLDKNLARIICNMILESMEK